MNTLHLIDTSAYFHRAFHALPPLSRPSDGFPVGAIHGFCGMIWRLQREFKPTYRALVLDAPGRNNFRTQAYAAYKANRSERNPDLGLQFDKLQACADAFGIPTVKVKGFEADDVIATMVANAARAETTAVMFTADKDMMQLVDDDRGIRMYDPWKKVWIDRAAVIAKFGVGPELVVDAQAMIGDTSDNVPGVDKVGPKTAAQLLADFGSLDGIFQGVEAGDRRIAPGLRARLATHRENAYISRDLVRLRDDLPIPVELDDLAVCEPDISRIVALLDEFELVSLKDEILGAPVS
ncbi:MAG: 5'-3' exonuclease H3TH domain-containing protein [Hyphomicrobiaceae bacterium]